LKFIKAILTASILLFLGVCLIFMLPSRTQSRVIEVTHAELQAALDRDISGSGVVGFLPRVRFAHLNLYYDKGLIIEGSGNWFSLGAGGFTLPDVSLIARLPSDASSWLVSEGLL
jgi:hypothetical protein